MSNEWYARDISKKRRISNKVKGAAGIPLGRPIYGYIKNPDNSGTWIIDEEAASVIKRIDTLFFSGLGSHQIADKLKEENVLTPSAYALSKGRKIPLKTDTRGPYDWGAASVDNILTCQQYCGDVINFRTYSRSYKDKRRLMNDPENVLIFKDVHEPIRDRETFERIQELRGKTRKRLQINGEHNMFSGFLVCADCGGPLHFHFNQGNKEIKYFNCANYNRGKHKICTSTHYIRYDFLERVVLSEIRRLTRFACKYEDKFTEIVAQYSKETRAKRQRIFEAELKYLNNRDKEIDSMFDKIYADNAEGKISDQRFSRLSEKYDKEQQSISERINQLKYVYNEQLNTVAETEMFISAVRKYTRAKKLTPLMLGELINHIEVFQAEIKDGVKSQKIIIHYNCIGAIVIPEDLPIPKINVSINTRRGVSVSYAPTASPV